MPTSEKQLNFEYQNINKLLHNRLRLALMASLTQNDEIDFVTLKKAVDTTDGNLSIQLKKLSGEGYVSTSKSYHKNRPQTKISLTQKGRQALSNYKDLLNSWLEDI